MVLRSGLVINKCIFNSVALSFFIFCIFLIVIFITILIFFIFFILLLICFLCIYYCVAFCSSFPFSGNFGSSLDSSFFLILLINVRVHTFCEGLYLRMLELGLKALIYFNNIGLKAIIRVSNKVLSGTKHVFAFRAH